MAQVSLVPYLSLDGDGPTLMAQECPACGARSFTPRRSCGGCQHPELKTVPAGETGTLTSYTVVSRAAPGVATPFVSAVVALDGGGSVRTNLVGVEPDPAAIEPGMRVELTTFVAHVDGDTEVVAPAFQPTKVRNSRG